MLTPESIRDFLWLCLLPFVLCILLFVRFYFESHRLYFVELIHSSFVFDFESRRLYLILKAVVCILKAVLALAGGMLAPESIRDFS